MNTNRFTELHRSILFAYPRKMHEHPAWTWARHRRLSIYNASMTDWSDAYRRYLSSSVILSPGAIRHIRDRCRTIGA